MVRQKKKNFGLLCSWRQTSEPKDLDSVLCYCFSNHIVIIGRVCGGRSELH